MEISQIIVTIRGTKGEAKKVTLDKSGKVLSGDESLVPLIRRALGVGSSGRPAPAPSPTSGGTAPTEPANDVIDAQPSQNDVWTQD